MRLVYNYTSLIADLLLDKGNMTDDFEYFSSIARGRSCTPRANTPEHQLSKGSQSDDRCIMADKGKEPLSRVHSSGKESHSSLEGCDTDMRPRTNSAPSKNHLLRVRNFQTTGKKFENRGDTVKSASHHSLVSSGNSSEGHSDTEETVGAKSNGAELRNTHRILLLGAEGVGKTAMTQQFLTSDDITGADYLGESHIYYLYLL